MAPKNAFLTFVVSTLQGRYPLRSRAMFGGYGLYYNNVIMGIIIDDALYLKAEAQTAHYFATQGATPFSYEKNGKTITMCYWRVPEDVLENQEELESWVHRAIFKSAHQ